MTREVTRTITDAEMSYCWKWYPETLFRGSKAMNAEGMIDAVTMISPAWYDILYDHVAGTPGTDNPFCDYDNDLQFNQICSITSSNAPLLPGQPVRRPVL